MPDVCYVPSLRVEIHGQTDYAISISVHKGVTSCLTGH